jgi:tetratricopeptide (TPR) repeat protein
MRKLIVIGVPVVAVMALGLAWWQFGHNTDPVAAAKSRMAHGDMRGAALYLTHAVRAQPGNAEAAFLLGKADMALANAAAAEQQFLHARADGYDKAAIVLPLGQSYLQQRHFTEVLRDFTADTAPPGAKAETLSLRASAQMSLHDLDDAAATAAQAEAIAPRNGFGLCRSGCRVVEVVQRHLRAGAGQSRRRRRACCGCRHRAAGSRSVPTRRFAAAAGRSVVAA